MGLKMAKHKSEIVLRALLNGMEVDIDGSTYVYLPKALDLNLDSCIAIKACSRTVNTEPVCYPVDISLSVFIGKCENIPDERIAIIAANLALINSQPKRDTVKHNPMQEKQNLRLTELDSRMRSAKIKRVLAIMNHDGVMNCEILYFPDTAKAVSQQKFNALEYLVQKSILNNISTDYAQQTLWGFAAELSEINATQPVSVIFCTADDVLKYPDTNLDKPLFKKHPRP
jgi:hypothetical protein